MGWLFMSVSKETLIERLVTSERDKNREISVLEHLCIHEGDYDVLWALTRVVDTDRSRTYIDCFLLDTYDGRWGYKHLCEEVFPYYFSCPLSYLEKADSYTNEQWRTAVRQFHMIHA